MTWQHLKWTTLLLAGLLVGCGQAPRAYLDDSDRRAAAQKNATDSAASQATTSSSGGGFLARFRSRCSVKDGYEVQPGDTLSEVAVTCNVPFSDLVAWNGLNEPYLIFPGQRLRLAADASTPTASSSGHSTSVQTAQASRLNWLWPTPRYDNYRWQKDSVGREGLIIRLAPGLDVIAVEAGEVMFAGESISQFGQMVMIRHANGFMTIYAHNRHLLVSEGQQVIRGQKIAESGQSGTAAHPQLYFEIRKDNQKVNVSDFLRPTSGR
ncbi:M23 family metallopeptidase [Thiomicrospira sp. ALE5]|uniref:M23 family metallopeptidase n=1 Tax=Thiomicrospira sp. ALE5 TaxID=748650 RepID=UPI0008EC9567|nr:M23 family metallopeptidase [Thiomicrospira sp. ALE5]SFR50403.1 lipoprotein NlpD [Thiomicrospira sp. ALE5]